MIRVANRQEEGQRLGRMFQLRGLGLAIAITIPSVTAAPLDVNITGEVVSAPCKIRAGDENLMVDLGAVVDKYLYINTRTEGTPFTLHLENCNTTTWRTVKLTFNGTANSAMPALLNVTGVNGIGVGIETMGTITALLPLGTASTPQILSTTTMLNFKAFVQGEPQALINKTITRGSFSAVATFLLEYQ